MSTEVVTTPQEEFDLGPEVASELAAAMESDLNEAGLLAEDDILAPTVMSAVTKSVPAPVLSTGTDTAKPVPPQPSSSRATSSGKSKKKKSSSSGNPSENTGRWTAEEHHLFLKGLEQHGKGWKKIAGLIKTRTVVQIRTHAQKYFQKLAKARQNGEDGDVAMEGRNCVTSVASASTTAAPPTAARRRPATGTKRKAIQSVVSSAIRQGKKLATEAAMADKSDAAPPLPSVSPALAHFVLPPKSEENNGQTTTVTTLQGTISGSVLEDSLFRFLTPAPVEHNETVVNDVARQVGANPISLPSDNPNTTQSATSGEISPTGVNELSLYPSWVDAKDMPAWYAKGADVDALLDVADALDWLADPGDLNEAYQDVEVDVEGDVNHDETQEKGEEEEETVEYGDTVTCEELKQEESRNLQQSVPEHSASVNSLPKVTSNVGSVVPPLPSIFDKAPSSGDFRVKQEDMQSTLPSSDDLKEHDDDDEANDDDDNIEDDGLEVFDDAMDEHDFVSTILKEHNDDALELDEPHLDEN